MQFSLFAIFAVIALCCVAPSYQYGTMFTDNITSAFDDETFIQGIKTQEGFSTDARIGAIQAQNVAGFSINTPGPVNSISKNLSFIASQGIEFDASDSLTVDAGGSLSLAGQRIDFDSSTLSISSEGDTTMGGIKSQIRAVSFELNTVNDAHLHSTGSTLDINAPVEVELFTNGIADIAASNNVQLLSRSGEASFFGDSVSVLGNFIDFDGEVSFSATSSDSMGISAAAIIEFASVGHAVNNLDSMNVAVSSGDIVLDAAGILTLQSDEVESSTMLFSAERNAFIVSRSSAESIIRIDSTADFETSARNSLSFGTFEQESDLTFSGQSDTSIDADNVSFTTSYGSVVGRNDMHATSAVGMTFEVTAQDLSATAATGNVELYATNGSFLLNTNDDFVASATDAFIDTQSDMTMTGNDVSYRQNNINAAGALRLDSASDISVDTGFLEFDTSGTLDFTMGLDFIVAAERISITGSKADADVTFNIDDSININTDGGDILYSGDVFELNTNRYFVDAVSLNSDVEGATLFEAGDSITIEAVDLLLISRFKAITFEAGDSITFNGNSNFEVDTQNFVMDAGNSLNINSGDRTKFFLDGSTTAEIEGQLSLFAPDTLSIDASNTAQFLQRSFILSSDDVTFDVDEAMYHSQNLPTDRFDLVNIDFIGVAGSSIQMLAGADFTLETDGPLVLSGDTAFDLNALNALTMNFGTLNVVANGEIDLHSGGRLYINVENRMDVNIENDLIINAPNGEHGLLSFSAANEVSFMADSSGFISAPSATYNVDSWLSVASEAQIGNDDGHFHTYTVGRTTMTADDSFDIRTGGPLSFFGRDELLITAQEITNMFAYTAIEQHADNIIFSSTDHVEFEVNFSDGRLTFEGTNFNSQAPSHSIGADEVQIFSGSNLRYVNTANLDIASDIVSFTAPSDFSSTSDNSLQMTTTNGGDITMFSGGDMLFSFDGDFTNTVAQAIEFEAGTFSTNTGASSTFTILGDAEMNASDGMVSHYAENFGSYTAGSFMEFKTIGSIFHDSGDTSYTGESVTAASTSRNGAIIFDATSNRVGLSAPLGALTMSSDSFVNYEAFSDISMDSASNLDIINLGDFDFVAADSVNGDIDGDMTFTSAASGHFESGNRIEFDATGNFEMNSGANFLVSTGEQGGLSIESAGAFTSLADDSQTWKSSDFFNVIVDVNGSFTTLANDISLFTTGGIAEIETVNGPLTATIGGDTYFTSGDLLRIRSTTSQAWDSNTASISATADQGNVILDFGNDDVSFTAGNAMVLQSKAQRNPTDGFKFNAEQNIEFLTDLASPTVISIDPFNSMDIGGDLNPTVQYLAGGDPTLAGITVGAAGSIITHAQQSVAWDASLGTFTADVGGTTLITADDTFIFGAAAKLSVDADSDIYVAGDSTFGDIGTGLFTATASSGLFNFNTEDGRLAFGAVQDLSVTARDFVSDVGNFDADGDNVNFVLSGELGMSTSVGEGGSITYDAGTTFDLLSVGAITMTTVGVDGAFKVDGTSFDISTLGTGDISFISAGDMDILTLSSTTYTSVNSMTINANSNRGKDLLDGDINLTTGDVMVISVGDSLSFAADRDLSVIAEQTISFSGRDVAISSVDDTIFRGDDLSATSDELIFENTVGLGGSVNFIAPSFRDTVDFSATNGITWNIGQNVVTESYDDTSFVATGQNNKQESIKVTTTATDAHLAFVSGSDLDFDATNDVLINTHPGANGEFSIHSKQLGTIRGSGGVNFVSQSGSIDFETMFGGIEFSNNNDAVAFFATGDDGRIVMEADGIARDSESAIFTDSDTGDHLFAAADGNVNINAYESIELLTHVSRSEINLGYLPPVVAGVFDTTGTGTTFVHSTGPNSDILFNTLEAETGLGSVNILAGNSVDPADSQVDFVTVKNLSFTQESGITFAGFNDILTTDRPSDIFFVASGLAASIEVSTSERAVLSDITIDSDAVLVDADNELLIRSSGSRRASTKFISNTERVTITVESSDPSNEILTTAYHGDIQLLGRKLIAMVAEDEARLIGRLGTTVSVQGELTLDVEGIISIDSSDKDINISTLEDFTLFAEDDVDFLADKDISFHTDDLELDASDDIVITSRSGNIYFNYGQSLDFSNVGVVTFSTANALTLPMREGMIVPGAICDIVGEFFIAHNNFYYFDFGYVSQIANIKDTGVMICYCNTPNSFTDPEYFCRPLAYTFP